MWLYYRFLLSYRDVEELLAERGVRSATRPSGCGAGSSGRPSPTGCAGGAPGPGDKWHLDEVQLKINGRKHWLWRAVDQDGLVLDILVQERRNQEAAEPFLRRVVEGEGYGAAGGDHGQTRQLPARPPAGAAAARSTGGTRA